MSRLWIEAPNNVFIDTDPLLLFLVGTYDLDLISKFRRLKGKYTDKDFQILRQFLTRAGIIVVTPGVLSEVSNLVKDRYHSDLIKSNNGILSQVKELYTPKDDILKSDALYKFGFTDTSIFLAAKDCHGHVLTADRPLYNYCRKFDVRAFHLEQDILGYWRYVESLA